MENDFIFKGKNFIYMIAGLLLIAFGFLLMSGGGSDDPNVFNDDIFNFVRLSIAPTLILLGFGVEVYAILLNPDKEK